MKKNTNQDPNNFDVIVIGSGLGGLSSAALMSKVNNKRVLVLEKHFETGGLTHEFKRGPYSWDVGLHYIGNMSKRLLDIVSGKVFNFVTGGNLKWNKMPDVYDRLIFPDFKIDVKSSCREYRDAFISVFPAEKKAIKKYFRDIHIARVWYLSYFFANFLRNPLKLIFKTICSILAKYNSCTTQEYMNKNIKDEKLRVALTARWGNYGVPPSHSSFAAHAVTEHHYLGGAVFPEGGAERIAVNIEKTIESCGGKILVNREVTEILVKNNRAYGVKVKNLNNSSEVVEYYAPIVISAAGAKNTYLRLIPQSIDLPIKKELNEHFHGFSGLNIYLGLKNSPESMGFKGENIWILDTIKLDGFTGNLEKTIDGMSVYCFVSFPSIKSGTKGGHTADIVSIIPYDYFAGWKTGRWKERENEYYEIKEKITNGVLNLVEKHLPGFKSQIVYKELATPLTFEHFSNTMNGAFYGLPETPGRYRIKDLQVKTPIKGLYLTGTDIISNGIVPALMSGMATVSYINGLFGIASVMAKVFSFKKPKTGNTDSFNANQVESEDKWYGELVGKEIENKNIYKLTFQFEDQLNFIGGQHIKLLVGDGEWRAYSVARVDNKSLTLMIDIRPDGVGANYAKNIQIGHKAFFRMPITDLVYHPSDREPVFIATGTGLIPFLHMMDELKKEGKKTKATVLFGCMSEKDLFIDNLLAPYKEYFDMKLVVVVEKPESDKHFKGRITDYLETSGFDLTEKDFYICGHPHMTEATVNYLRSRGADRIYY